MGAIVVSIDAELGWGFHDFDSPPSERIERARWGWSRLLDVLERYDVPATWAVVGHLLLEDCDGRHEDHPAGPEWFERERTDWRDRTDLRFGRDLVDAVRNAGPDHEVGSHTFSHLVFGDPDTSREAARAELELFDSVANRADLGASSFVFPRNDVGHRDLLAEFGFDCYRGAMPEEHRRGPLGKLTDSTVGSVEPRLVRPAVDEYGLVNVPPSMYLFGFEGLPRRITSALFEDPVVAHARAGVEAAAEGDGIFHMWLHPNNVTTASDVERLDRIFAAVDDRRDDLALWTMGEVAASTEPRATTAQTG